MAIDAFEYGVGGLLHDRYGRPEFQVVTKHQTPAAADTLRGYEATDADGRRQVVMVDSTGADLGLAAALTGPGRIVGGGFSNVPGAESVSSTTYAKLPTPDQVQNLVLPANGLFVIRFQALWQQSGANVARAAIFIGANQLKSQLDSASVGNTVGTVAGVPAGAPTNQPLVSAGPWGIVSPTNQGNPSDVTTGQAVGVAGNGLITCAVELGGTLETGTFPPWGQDIQVFAAAGTYTISVQYKSSAGSVTASGRKLWVQTLAFA
jgi:hypothetical protein